MPLPFLAVACAVALVVASVYAAAWSRGSMPVGHPWIGLTQVVLAAWAVFQRLLTAQDGAPARIRAGAALAMSVVGCAVWVWATLVVWAR